MLIVMFEGWRDVCVIVGRATWWFDFKSANGDDWQLPLQHTRARAFQCDSGGHNRRRRRWLYERSGDDDRHPDHNDDDGNDNDRRQSASVDDSDDTTMPMSSRFCSARRCSITTSASEQVSARVATTTAGDRRE